MTQTQVPQRGGGRDVVAAGTGARFVVLEGLSGVGKSTVASLLADELGANLMETLLPPFDDARVQVDRSRLLMPRLHFWMMCNYAVSDVVREHLAQGRDVVVESYFHRTLATHAAMGATQLPVVDWDRAVRPDLTVLLTIDESERQVRLAERDRDGALSYWSRLEESNVEVTRRTYASFGLTALDTTGLDVAEVARRLTKLADATGVRHG
jgi:thymidylate kinase